MQFSTTKTKQDDKDIIQREKRSESKIHDLDIQRHELLESVSFMTSQPQREHSYREKYPHRKKVSSQPQVQQLVFSTHTLFNMLFLSSDTRNQYDI